MKLEMYFLKENIRNIQIQNMVILYTVKCIGFLY